MKKVFWLLCFFPLLCLSQEGQLSVDLPAGYYANFKDWKENGVMGGIEVSYLKNKFVYGGAILFGCGFSKNINNKDGYVQAQFESDLLIGKKYSISPKISVIPQIGIGYLHLTNHFQGDPENLIGLPIQTKILFFEGKSFAFGLIPRAKFNKTQNIYALNIALHFKL